MQDVIMSYLGIGIEDVSLTVPGSNRILTSITLKSLFVMLEGFNLKGVRHMNQTSPSLPRVGMMATLRNRRGAVVEVTPYQDPDEGDLHLVRVEYTDSDGIAEDAVIWEVEQKLGATLLEPTALPRVSDEGPMAHDDYDALVRAARWSALTPFIQPEHPDKLADLPIASPFHGAIQTDDFQIVPLLKALKMPRISLLLADDVGLGKTIEAGLILQELILRRRIRRVLVICPASLRNQWQQEMHDKFSLSLDIIDREETHALRKRLGLDANPWRIFPRIVSSYHYLRQADVLEQFLSICRIKDDEHSVQAQLPWDLLIVDEAHNLMPTNFGDDSDLTKMLRAITPYFEHKLFLTATPHNGHTRCFSGLLELLDPVRFTQVSEFSEPEKQRIADVMVRRLKKEINALDDRLERPRRFAERYPKPVPLFFTKEEAQLSQSVSTFKKAVKEVISNSNRSGRIAGAFAIEVLSKRLLSCPYTFAESWMRFRKGISEDESADVSDVTAARKAHDADSDDDREKEERTRHASRIIGAWLQPFAYQLTDEIGAVDKALTALHLIPDGDLPAYPLHDSRLERLIGLIDSHLRLDGQWLDTERLIVFTEYKTTLDYLQRRILTQYKDSGTRIRVLFGGMDQAERDEIRAAFNDPDDPVRLLIATDAASEGLNLQETARLLLHYDVPWNPARLEQRNGRLDRHGQARDVFVHHFTSEDDADLEFLAKVVGKVEVIRDDLLGLVGEVFDAAFQRRFIDQDDSEIIIRGLDSEVDRIRGKMDHLGRTGETGGPEETARLLKLCRDIDLSPRALCDTLDTALSLQMGRPRLEGPDERGRMRLLSPIPPRWQNLVDDTLRLPRSDGSTGPLPALVFDPNIFVVSKEGRPVFRPQRDASLLHLGHPILREALTAFARLRFPGHTMEHQASRWTVRRGLLPESCDALVLLTLEELSMNELREPFHHWVTTLRIPVRQQRVGEALPYLAPADDDHEVCIPDLEAIQTATALWDTVSYDLSALIKRHGEDLTRNITTLLKEAKFRALDEQSKAFANRIREVERAMAETTIARLEREKKGLEADLSQGFLFDSMLRDAEGKLANLEEELKRRRNHYEELIRHLKKERGRILNEIIPTRFTLKDTVRVFPISVEIRLPMVASR